MADNVATVDVLDVLIGLLRQYRNGILSTAEVRAKLAEHGVTLSDALVAELHAGSDET